MAFDHALADRLRPLVLGEEGVTERRTFGGLAFLINGNLAVSARGEGGLLVRVPPGETDALAREPHARRFLMRGRVMDGWLRLEASGVEAQPELERWVRRGVDHARSLPPKSSGAG